MPKFKALKPPVSIDCSPLKLSALEVARGDHGLTATIQAQVQSGTIKAMRTVKLANSGDRDDFAAEVTGGEESERERVSQVLLELAAGVEERLRIIESEGDSTDSAGSNGNENQDSEPRKSGATRLVELAVDAKLFHDAQGTAFVEIEINGTAEILRVRAYRFIELLSARFFAAEEKAPSREMISDAINVLEGKARFEGPERTLDPSYYADQMPGGDGADAKPSQATLLVDLVSNEGVDLFHDHLLEPYITIPLQGHREIWALRARASKNWLQRLFFERTGKALSTQGLTDGLGVLEAKAKFDGPEEEVFVRIAEANGVFYIDLANDNWEAIEVTPGGWKVISNPPVKFCRRRGMESLPMPACGGRSTSCGLSSTSRARTIGAYLSDGWCRASGSAARSWSWS
jgi:hypothetical protein